MAGIGIVRLNIAIGNSVVPREVIREHSYSLGRIAPSRSQGFGHQTQREIDWVLNLHSKTCLIGTQA